MAATPISIKLLTKSGTPCPCRPVSAMKLSVMEPCWNRFKGNAVRCNSTREDSSFVAPAAIVVSVVFGFDKSGMFEKSWQ